MVIRRPDLLIALLGLAAFAACSRGSGDTAPTPSGTVAAPITEVVTTTTTTTTTLPPPDVGRFTVVVTASDGMTLARAEIGPGVVWSGCWRLEEWTSSQWQDHPGGWQVAYGGGDSFFLDGGITTPACEDAENAGPVEIEVPSALFEQLGEDLIPLRFCGTAGSACSRPFLVQ